MKINKIELQKALEIVKPGLANKEIIEQSTAFAFIKGRVVTYNDEISLSHPIKGLEVEGAIQATELYQLLGKLKSEEVEIEVKGSEILLSSGRSKAGLTLQQEIKLPLKEIGEQGKWKPLPENFLKHLGFAMTSCSRDMSRPVLTCININGNHIEASDGYRITRCELEEEMPVKGFLLPATSAVELHKLKPVQVAEGDGWMHFQTEVGTVMSCRIFEDEFPNINSHLEVEGVQITLPRVMNEIMDRAEVFAKRDYMLDESIEITLENKHIRITAKSDTGWFEEEMPIRYEDSPVSFSIAPYLLKGILEETLVGVLSENRLRFEGEGWIYVTVLKETIQD